MDLLMLKDYSYKVINMVTTPVGCFNARELQFSATFELITKQRGPFESGDY